MDNLRAAIAGCLLMLVGADAHAWKLPPSMTFVKPNQAEHIPGAGICGSGGMAAYCYDLMGLAAPDTAIFMVHVHMHGVAGVDECSNYQYAADYGYRTVRTDSTIWDTTERLLDAWKRAESELTLELKLDPGNWANRECMKPSDYRLFLILPSNSSLKPMPIVWASVAGDRLP